jgi:hypothetical protein
MELARESYNYDLYSKEKKGEFQFRKRNIIEEKKPRPYIGYFFKDRIFFVDSFKNFDDMKHFLEQKTPDHSMTNIRKFNVQKEKDKTSTEPKFLLSKYDENRQMEDEDLDAYITNFFI